MKPRDFMPEVYEELRRLAAAAGGSTSNRTISRSSSKANSKRSTPP